MEIHDTLRGLVVKNGVLLGALPPVQRACALGIAAAAIAEGAEHSEPQVNAALKRCLAEEGAFLDADHVALRRWLVDTGWWRRDGFGRSYVRVPAAELPAALQAVRQALDALDPAAWVAAERTRVQRERALRRAAWVDGDRDG
jgi:hypothetical protein